MAIQKKKTIAKKASGGEKSLKVDKFLKVVADNNRLRILCILGDQTMNVTDIYKKLKLPQNLTSHHISKLKELELLNEKREGTFRNYSVNKKKLKEYNNSFKDLLKI